MIYDGSGRFSEPPFFSNQGTADDSLATSFSPSFLRVTAFHSFPVSLLFLSPFSIDKIFAADKGDRSVDFGIHDNVFVYKRHFFAVIL